MLRAKRKDNAIPELVELPPIACQYMREELACEHPLAQAISDLPLESGHVYIFATESIPAERLLDLREVPFISTDDVGTCWLAFVDFATDYLGRGGKRTLMMGNPYITHDYLRQWLQRTPLRLGREWTDWCVCGEYIGFYVTEMADKWRIHDFFNDIQAQTTFGILTHDVNLPLHDELPLEVLQRAVAQADYVVIGAYDDSSMLIWSR
jgi:hypothetical protein